jgi:site-specific recombinase XerD
VEEGYGSGAVQELFGLKDVKATNVHRHVLKRGGREGAGEKVLGFLKYR